MKKSLTGIKQYLFTEKVTSKTHHMQIWVSHWAKNIKMNQDHTYKLYI